MKKATLVVLFAGLVVMTALGQTPLRLAAINEKVVGKWWAADQKNYIEFLDNGVCSEGALFPDGKWHIETGKLEAWQQGDSFRCLNGVLTLIRPGVLTCEYGMGGEAERFYRGLRTIPKRPTLTLALAQKILSQQINSATAKNTLFTCRACYDPDDKEDNDKAPVMTTYSALVNDFLMRQGYIRTSGQQKVFTAKAKRSKYYEGLAGLRLANFKNPRILTNRIVDPMYIPIEYDFVPTDLTMGLFGKVQRVQTFASFTYQNEAWSVRVSQSNDLGQTNTASVGQIILGSNGHETGPGAIPWVLLLAIFAVVFALARKGAGEHQPARASSGEAHLHPDIAGVDRSASRGSESGASNDQERSSSPMSDEHPPVGPRNAEVYKGSSWWTEGKAGRIDKEGNIYKGSSWWTEEKVGRIDKEGNIQEGSSWWTEEKAGRIDKEGNIYKGSSWWTEEKVGRIDEEGNVQKGSSWWTEEKVGRVDDKSSGGDSSGSGSPSGCWLTTACMEYAGHSDSCHELVTLRSFRDTYVTSRSDGAALIAEYRQFAPLILRAISNRPDRRRLYSFIFKSVSRSVVLIERHDFDGALKVYSRCYSFLKRRLPLA